MNEKEILKSEKFSKKISGPQDSESMESRILRFWEKEKIYKYNPKLKNVYSIDNPPPTVSGKMHVGHVFQYSQMDFIARFWRMKTGVFYPFGTDDNGLPTEKLVEKLNKVKSKEMSRDEFIKLCLKTLKKITPEFIQNWKDIGISADYDLYYSTIDDNSRKISQKSFLELFKKKEIYKKKFPTIWCPECQTSVAQAELEDKEGSSLFSTLKFKCGGKDLLIATTRPELLEACVAVFVNPKDKRYKKLIGKKAKVPIFNQEVPIIADESAKMDKGTGALMVCSYGDKYDVEAIKKHKLKPKTIFEKDGTIRGINIKEARKKVFQDLKKNNLIKSQKQISNVVNVHDKCGTEIEFLDTEQWFIKVLDKKKKWIELGRKIEWRPKFMQKRYENWVNGLEWDWSISRDRHFGVPIPVWECEKCDKIILPNEKELPVDTIQVKKKCSCGEIAKPEEKVLDTWATSSLTPQICSSLVKKGIKIPFSMRTNAHDIIRTWDFYTIVKSFYHEKKIPWENMMVTGFSTLKGEKMSKSKGNVINPEEVLKKYSADAVRFWAASSKLGEDADYQEKEVIAGKKFINKLRNASRFVFMNLSKPKKVKLIETDRLFLSQVNNLIENSTKNYTNYEYSKVKLAVENFFWNVFCSHYLEIVKHRVYNGTKQEKESAFYTLYNSLFAILKLIAPIMPFVTEEIYQEHFRKGEKEKSIHICKWVEKFKISSSKKDKKVFKEILDFNSEIWKKKKDSGKNLKDEIEIKIPKRLQDYKKDLMCMHNII